MLCKWKVCFQQTDPKFTPSVWTLFRRMIFYIARKLCWVSSVQPTNWLIVLCSVEHQPAAGYHQFPLGLCYVQLSTGLLLGITSFLSDCAKKFSWAPACCWVPTASFLIACAMFSWAPACCWLPPAPSLIVLCSVEHQPAAGYHQLPFWRSCWTEEVRGTYSTCIGNGRQNYGTLLTHKSTITTLEN